MIEKICKSNATSTKTSLYNLPASKHSGGSLLLSASLPRLLYGDSAGSVPLTPEQALYSTSALQLNSVLSLSATLLVLIFSAVVLWRYRKLISRYKAVIKKQGCAEIASQAGGNINWTWSLPDNRISFSPKPPLQSRDLESGILADKRLWTRLLHPDDQEVFIRMKEYVLKNCAKRFQHECRIVNKSNTFTLCILSGAASDISGKGTVGAISGSILFIPELQLSHTQSPVHHFKLNSQSKSQNVPSSESSNVYLSAPPFNKHSATRKKILVTDDDPFIRQLIPGLLMEENYKFILVSTGEDAIKKLRNQQIDVAIIDLEIPEMNGFEIARKLKAMTAINPPPLICMTAHNAQSIRKKAADAGFCTLLTKPLDPAILSQTLNSILKGKQPGRSMLQHGNMKQRSDTTINFEVALHHVEGNQTLLRRLLKNVLHDHHQDLDKLKQYNKNRNSRAARRLVHTLKGIAGTIGAQDLEQSCELLELQTSNSEESLNQFEKSFTTLMREIEAACAGLEDQTPTYKKNEAQKPL